MGEMDTVYLLVNNQPSQNSPLKKKSPKNDNHNPEKFWTPEIEKDFIRLVKEERVLWDNNLESFRSRCRRLDIFEKILKEMKELWPEYKLLFTRIRLMKKYKNFKTYYMREKKKMKNDPKYVPRWQHIKDMEFLDGYLVEKKYKSSPIIIEFPDGNRKYLKNVVQEKVQMSSRNDKLKASSMEDSMYEEDHSEETFYENNHSYTNNEEITPKSKKRQLKAQVVSVGPDFFSSVQKIQKAQCTHDEAFANFIAQDLEKIPEGKQKEQLRFKILEMIHQCKMDTNFLLD